MGAELNQELKVALKSYRPGTRQVEQLIEQGARLSQEEWNEELRRAIREVCGPIAEHEKWALEQGKNILAPEWYEGYKASIMEYGVRQNNRSIEWLIKTQGAQLSEEEWNKFIGVAKDAGRPFSKLEQFRDGQLAAEYDEVLPTEEGDSGFIFVQRPGR